ncbi:mRNA decay activator protein ZFP36L2-like [Terrapene carolina triunguis]|uniref:mRNA decay activator protein ZFP36L2-like n=1 Tax=Terrapene triunguis TaxID=2587831 RepID=UPI000E778644|nr:mRNA decay activator protein ZFP36L2-like [Terrapene carolina triunguis]
MPSDLLTPFAELDDPLCQAFLRLNVGEEPGLAARCPVGYQRAFSASPAAPSGSAEPLEDGVGASDAHWSLPGQWGWAPVLPRTSLQRIPFRAERSASVIEGCREGAAAASSRYKTELCRTYEESGVCKYGAKCQFAHGAGELRGLSRHPKYKTELCRTFHTAGFCPYGSRCHFIHNAEEQRQPPRLGGRSPSFSRSASLSPSASPPAPGPCCCRHPAGEPPCLAFPATVALGQDGAGGAPAVPDAFAFPGQLSLQRSPSSDSLSDQEESGGSSGSESPGLGPSGRRLPIFSRLSVSD